MFLDGVNYANVANNLANGHGSVWSFSYSATFLHHYDHQLPLMIWTQALCYSLLGDGLWVERLYCLMLLVANTLAIRAVWFALLPDQKSHYGLPLLLWLITPIVFWSFANNVQEMLMSVTSLYSCYFMFKYYTTCRTSCMLWAGVMCFLCYFCKGPQGLFPLVMPLLYHICIARQSITSVMKDTLLIAAPAAILQGLLLLYAPARLMLYSNFGTRLSSTFVTEVQHTTSDRFDLWSDLLMELLPAIGLVLMVYLLRRGWKSNRTKSYGPSIFFLLLGLSASLPLIVTLEQRRFYLMTSIGFFAIGLAYLLLPLIANVTISKVRHTWASTIMIVLTVGVLVYAATQQGVAKRDQALIADVHMIGEHYANTTLAADPALANDYRLLAYMARYYNISLDFTVGGTPQVTAMPRSQALPECDTCLNGRSYRLVR